MRTSAASAMGHSSDPVRVAQTEPPHSRTATVKEDESNPGVPGERVVLDEVVVTGSHIRGAQNLSSPVIRFDREDIERSGYSTTQQLMKSLPQNVSNVSDTTFGGVNGGTNTDFGASAPNLRGLGSDSTLVLVNGRRLAAAGRGDFTDISLIPLNAIERIEVLTDGASAIYGSDAVGGVINFVLRDDFEGAETHARYGSVTAGSHSEWQAGQMFGGTWRGGHGFISYEYYKRSALDGADRDFIQANDWLPNYEAIPEQRRQSAMAVVSQQLSSRIEVFADAFVGDRESAYAYNSFGTGFDVAAEVKQVGGSLGFKVALPHGWQGALSGLLDQSQSEQEYVYSATGNPSHAYSNEYRLWSVDLSADGRLFGAPGGEARLAVGGQVRDERFVEAYPAYPAKLGRDVKALYGELQLPLVGEPNERFGIKQFEVSLAGRVEDYSDFGSTLNPKFGLSWVPMQGLNLRTTWGTSFKAPLLTQLNPSDLSVAIYENMFATQRGQRTGMLLSGSGANLEPEESTNWTAGFDFRPSAAPGLDISATYFDTEYENRVRPAIPSGYNPFRAPLDPLYASVVNLNPSLGSVQTYLSHPSAYCLTAQIELCENFPNADAIEVVVDDRLRNLSKVQVRGMDFSVSYQWEGPFGTLALQTAGTRLLDSSERLRPGALYVSAMDDVWRPAKLRTRSSISFASGSFTAATYLNYTDGYRDRRSADIAGAQQRTTVASWTTVDAALRYGLRDWPAGLETSMSLAVMNLFDRDPPFVSSTMGIYFDGVNASPLGRFASAQVTLRW